MQSPKLNAVAVALADRRRNKVRRVMQRDTMPFALRLAAITAMGGEGRTM